MTDTFDLNFPILKERFPRLLNLVEKKIPDDFEVMTTRSGAITGRYKSTLLHSLFEPIKEGEQFARSAGINSGDYILLYGLGLGYHLKPVLDTIGSSGKLLVIELNREIMSAAFTLIKFTEILSYPNFGIVSGNNDKEVSENLNYAFSKEWNKHSHENSKTLIHQSSFKCIPVNFKKIKTTFEMQLIEKQTKITWSEHEKNNYMINQDYVKKGNGIKKLLGKYKGKPAFLIGAGPSLNRTLPFLSKLSKMFYLVAVDTSLPILLKSQIKPHFFVSIDPQEISFNHISNYVDKSIPVILTPTANPKTVLHYSGNKYFVVQRTSSIDEIEIEELIREKGESKGGGSVSCITLDIMVQMGFDPIIFIGQDCSFPNNRLFAENSQEDEAMINLLHYHHTLETMSCEKIREKKEVTIENKFGAKLPSHQHLHLYLRYLEQIVQNYKHVTFYNWLSQGAKMEGVIDIESINEIFPHKKLRAEASCEE
ncbi:MAG TPA: 6-hydroxymethylpterin diphosphokinase MptE-like protein [Nitrospinota bacterium]|nr:6-hydroxymethylpterin diphosphokinase MptE-like protein [Nitrospinota bacterium]